MTEKEQLDRLTAELARRAEADGLLDLAWRRLDSPIGSLLLAATECGVVRVVFPVEDEESVLEDLAIRISPRLLQSPRRLDRAARALDDFFDGVRHPIEVAVDLRLVRGYRAEVVRALRGISFGTTISYADLAAVTGRPRAVRAVGTACAQNPVPLLLPCHRVIRSDGGYGAYRGGAEVKAYLLELEGGSGVPAAR